MADELGKFEIERRLTRLEEKTTATNEIVLRMDTKLDAWQANYYPKEQIDEMFKLRDQQIRNVQENINVIQMTATTDKQSRNMTKPQWILAITSIGSVIVAFVAVFKG